MPTGRECSISPDWVFDFVGIRIMPYIEFLAGPPYAIVNKVYVLDNYGNPENSTKSSFNEFDIQSTSQFAEPILTQGLDLAALAGAPDDAAVQVGGAALTYDYQSTPPEIIFNTGSNTTTNPLTARAALWSFEP